MAEKITYQELIEILEKNTKLNKTQVDDFVKKWITIINEGLERDGRVRISDFGVFKLQSIDERSGFNPQTREPITIPAHTKVVFNGSKKLNEHVNRRYNLLQAKPITNVISSDIRKKADTIKKSETVQTDSEKERQNIVDQLAEFGESKTIESSVKMEDVVEDKIQNESSVKETDTDKSISEKKHEIDKVKIPPKKEESKGIPFDAEKVQVVVQKDKKDEKKPDRTHMPVASAEKKKNKIWIYIAAVLLLLIILFVILFWPEKDEPLEQIADKSVTSTPVKKPDLPKPVVKKKKPGTPGGEHSVKRGDKLWNLSNDYYNNAYLWPNIYRVNNEEIPNPDILMIGYRIIVPPLEGTYLNLTSKDSVNISIGFYRAYEAYKAIGNEWAKYYLWVCRRYDKKTFQDIKNQVDKEDASFAEKMK